MTSPRVLLQQALDQESRGSYELALQLLFETRRGVTESEPDLALSILDGISRIQGRMDRFEEAIRTAEEILELQGEVYGPASPEAGRAKIRLGCLHSDRGMEAVAALHFKSGLEILESLLDPEDPDLLDARLKKWGLPNLQPSLVRSNCEDIIKRLQGQIDPRCLGLKLRAFMILARSFASDGATSQARELIRKAVDIATIDLHCDHPEAFAAIDAHINYMSPAERHELLPESLPVQPGLASADSEPDMPEFFAAVSRFLEGVEDSIRQALGPRSLPYAALRERQARHVLDSPASADAYLEEARSIYREVLGPRHPDVARVSVNLALQREARDEIDGVAAALEEARWILEANLGQDHPDVRMVRMNQAAFLANHGDRQQRLEGIRSMLDLKTCEGPRPHDPDIPEMAQILITLLREDGASKEEIDEVRRDFQTASFLEAQLDRLDRQKFAPDADPAELLQELEELNEIADDRLGPEHPVAENLIARQAEIHRIQGDLEEAKRLFYALACRAEDREGASSARALANREIVAEICREAGDFAEAVQHDEYLLKHGRGRARSTHEESGTTDSRSSSSSRDWTTIKVLGVIVALLIGSLFLRSCVSIHLDGINPKEGSVTPSASGRNALNRIIDESPGKCHERGPDRPNRGLLSGVEICAGRMTHRGETPRSGMDEILEAQPSSLINCG